jgi:hypothetical protein
LFREMNGRLSELYLQRKPPHRTFVCECGDKACTDGIVLTVAEYDAVRDHPTRFAIVRGHEFDYGERVAAVNDGFSTVEKPLSL